MCCGCNNWGRGCNNGGAKCDNAGTGYDNSVLDVKMLLLVPGFSNSGPGCNNAGPGFDNAGHRYINSGPGCNTAALFLDVIMSHFPAPIPLRYTYKSLLIFEMLIDNLDPQVQLKVFLGSFLF